MPGPLVSPHKLYTIRLDCLVKWVCLLGVWLRCLGRGVSSFLENVCMLLFGTCRVLNTEVSSFHRIGGSTVNRGVLISGCWNRGVPLYTEVSSFQGVGIEEFYCIQKCSHFRVLE